MNPEPYAQALWQMLEKGAKPKETIAKLRVILGRQGREALFPKIARAFARIAARENRKNTVTLSIARAKDERGARKAVAQFLKEMDVLPKDIRVETDEGLIGGWRLEGREHLVDASYKKYLLDLFQQVTNATAPTPSGRGPDLASGYNRATE